MHGVGLSFGSIIKMLYVRIWYEDHPTEYFSTKVFRFNREEPMSYVCDSGLNTPIKTGQFTVEVKTEQGANVDSWFGRAPWREEP